MCSSDLNNMLLEIILSLALLLVLYLLIRNIRLNRKIAEIKDFVNELSRGNLKKRFFLNRGDVIQS